MLVAAIRNTKADMFGHLEAGQILRLEPLAYYLQIIANTPEEELYKYITDDNRPTFTEALKLTFMDYDVYVPNFPTAGPILSIQLQHIEAMNFSQDDTKKPIYMYRLGELTQAVYTELNISRKFHQGTSSNVAVMDMNDNYVSVVT